MMLDGGNLQVVKARVCGKSTTGRKNIFQRIEWTKKNVVPFGGKMAKGRMDLGSENGSLVLGSAASSGKALDTPAHLIHFLKWE